MSTAINSASWRHHGYVTQPEVDTYLYSLLPARDEVLSEMEAEATRNKIPIVGPVVASFFQQLVMMTGAKTVFEMGSAIGYSTIWWARAVGEGGRVHYTDSDPKNAEKARRYFQRAGVRRCRQGDAGSSADRDSHRQLHAPDYDVYSFALFDGSGGGAPHEAGEDAGGYIDAHA